MKKLLFIALALIVSSGATAQDKVWKKALALGESGKTAEALEMIKPALESAETTDKAGAYNALARIYFKQFAEQQSIDLLNKAKGESKPVDQALMNTSVYEAFKAFLQSDEYEQQPDAKGKVKFKYRPEVSKTYYNQRPNLINAGQYFYNLKDNENAKKIWSLYIDSKNAPLFADHAAEPDQYVATLSYYNSFLAYQTDDFDTFKKYIGNALNDPEQAKAAEEINVAMLQNHFVATKNPADSIAFLNAAKAAHEKYPDVQRYFDVIARCYINDQAQLTKFMDEEIAKNPDAVLPYQSKGDMAMNDGKFEDAIDLFKKVVDKEPENIAAVYNLGVCYYNKANNLKDELSDKKTGALTKANADKVKEILADAQTYLEKARALDPAQETCRWAYILGNTYYVRGETDKYEEVSKYIKR